MVHRHGEFGRRAAKVAGDGGAHGWDGLTFCACSLNSQGSPGDSPGHGEDLQLLRDVLGLARFCILSSALTVLAFVGRQKLSYKMSDQL